MNLSLNFNTFNETLSTCTTTIIDEVQHINTGLINYILIIGLSLWLLVTFLGFLSKLLCWEDALLYFLVSVNMIFISALRVNMINAINLESIGYLVLILVSMMLMIYKELPFIIKLTSKKK